MGDNKLGSSLEEACDGGVVSICECSFHYVEVQLPLSESWLYENDAKGGWSHDNERWWVQKGDQFKVGDKIVDVM